MSKEIVFLKSRVHGKVTQRTLEEWQKAEENPNGNPYKKCFWYKITAEEAGLVKVEPQLKEASEETIQEAKKDEENLS